MINRHCHLCIYFWPCRVACGMLVPQPGHPGLTTEPLGNSQQAVISEEENALTVHHVLCREAVQGPGEGCGPQRQALFFPSLPWIWAAQPLWVSASSSRPRGKTEVPVPSGVKHVDTQTARSTHYCSYRLLLLLPRTHLDSVSTALS